jgi:hypothetical protein
MRSKITIAILSGIILTLLFAFVNKAPDNESKVAIVSLSLGKANKDSFIIFYGDGKTEQIFIDYAANPSISTAQLIQFTSVANYLKHKGYGFVGMPGYMGSSCNLFEKN